MKKITIVIVSFKSDKAIYNCLSSINKKYPVIVIENSSDFYFKKKIEEKHKNVKCILAKKNLGFGKANNIGLYTAKTNYVLLLNPDTKLKKDTVSILIKIIFGGEKGIRTLDTFNSIHAFQAGAFNHSAISPIHFYLFLKLQ